MGAGGWGLAALSRGLGSMLFASPCSICGADDGPFCADCRAEILDCGSQCPRCALSAGPWADLRGGCSACRGRPLGFDRAIALGPYQGPIREVCLRMKHFQSAWIARWSVDLLIEARGDRLREAEAELIVAVPLHWRRRLRRGYNQADAIAGALSSRLGIRRGSPLARVAATPKLARLPRQERADLMKQAFGAKRHPGVEGKAVMLVDDVLTTGATCGAAARALKRAGAKRVIAVVLARAESRS